MCITGPMCLTSNFQRIRIPNISISNNVINSFQNNVMSNEKYLSKLIGSDINVHVQTQNTCK